MKRLTKQQVLALHSEMICETGGSNGIRDEGLLDSALNAPFQSFGDTEALSAAKGCTSRFRPGTKSSFCRWQ